VHDRANALRRGTSEKNRTVRRVRVKQCTRFGAKRKRITTSGVMGVVFRARVDSTLGTGSIALVDQGVAR
jgi:hypothetical protein